MLVAPTSELTTATAHFNKMSLDLGPPHLWDQVVVDLLNQSGIAWVVLPTTSQIPQAAFGAARRALASIDGESAVTPLIQPNSDSAHVTGYHPSAGSLSRYNRHRRGFVWSDEAASGLKADAISIQDCPEFAPQMNALVILLHDIADRVLGALERHWSLPTGYFLQQFGLESRTSSQWHVKEFTKSGETMGGGDLVHPSSKRSDDYILLPVHTDPSLISIVMHDSPANVASGAQGLQYHHHGTWQPVPRGGPGVAVVLVGSVLDHVTGGALMAAKHRVVAHEQLSTTRLAATLFVRPAPHSVLSSTLIPGAQQRPPTKRTKTFAEWNARVARNYQKHQAKQPAAT
jgi:isopenicillin N synthase-like dioxygenase